MVPPSGERPIPAYEAANFALGPATLASQASANPKPPPAAAPFIAATNIFGERLILRIRGCNFPVRS